MYKINLLLYALKITGCQNSEGCQNFRSTKNHFIHNSFSTAIAFVKIT